MVATGCGAGVIGLELVFADEGLVASISTEPFRTSGGGFSD